MSSIRGSAGKAVVSKQWIRQATLWFCAWGAVWVGLGVIAMALPVMRSRTAIRRPDVAGWVDLGVDRNTWRVSRYRGFGWTAIVWASSTPYTIADTGWGVVYERVRREREDEDAHDPADQRRDGWPPESHCDPNVMNLSDTKSAVRAKDSVLYEVLSGVPFTMFRGVVELDKHRSGTRVEYRLNEVRGAWMTSRGPFLHPRDLNRVAIVPFGVVWEGASANGACAAVVCVAWAGAGVMWRGIVRARRLRRGECTECGYSRASDGAGDKCPECGTEDA